MESEVLHSFAADPQVAHVRACARPGCRAWRTRVGDEEEGALSSILCRWRARLGFAVPLAATLLHKNWAGWQGKGFDLNLPRVMSLGMLCVG